MQANPAVVAAYESAIPEDPRIERKKMFGLPCAFIERQMFFGTFGDTVIARVGPERSSELATTPGVRIFMPMPDRAWADYVQLDLPVDASQLADLALEALKWTEKLPPKDKKAKKARAKGKTAR